MIFTHNRITIIFRKILALYCFSSLLSVANAVSDPTATLIWLKPIESDQKMKNNTIVEGSALDLMQFVANQIPEVNHQFEAYSIKRGWHLIAKSKNKNAVYCFWGADYTAEREEWGYYTKPTSVTLPFMVAARKGVLSAYDNNGSVSVKQLLKNGYSTVIFENVINAWTEAVEQAGYHGVVQISDLDKDLSDHTLLMIEKRRIDFGYISHRVIANLDVHNNHNITLYDVSELPDADGGDARLLCSKTPLGNKMVGLINKALAKIHGNTSLNHQMKLLIFKSEGYPERFKSAFERQWNKAYPTVKND